MIRTDHPLRPFRNNAIKPIRGGFPRAACPARGQPPCHTHVRSCRGIQAIVSWHFFAGQSRTGRCRRLREFGVIDGIGFMIHSQFFFPYSSLIVMSILYLLSFETRGFCRLYIPIYLYCFIFSHLIAVIQVLPLITLGSFDFRPKQRS